MAFLRGCRIGLKGTIMTTVDAEMKCALYLCCPDTLDMACITPKGTNQSKVGNM